MLAGIIRATSRQRLSFQRPQNARVQVRRSSLFEHRHLSDLLADPGQNAPQKRKLIHPTHLTYNLKGCACEPSALGPSAVLFEACRALSAESPRANSHLRCPGNALLVTVRRLAPLKLDIEGVVRRY